MTEQLLLRQAKRRLAMQQHAEEVTGNVAHTCRYYGISRTCFADEGKGGRAADSSVSAEQTDPTGPGSFWCPLVNPNRLSALSAG